MRRNRQDDRSYRQGIREEAVMRESSLVAELSALESALGVVKRLPKL
jgi:hypothetical protein